MMLLEIPRNSQSAAHTQAPGGCGNESLDLSLRECQLPPSQPSCTPAFSPSREEEIHQAAAQSSPELTGPLVWHPHQTMRQHQVLIHVCATARDVIKEAVDLRHSLALFILNLASAAQQQTPGAESQHHKGAEGTRPAGQQNVPNMLHLLFYASFLPHQPPQALLPNPRSTPGAAGRLRLPVKAGARQGGSLSKSITLQSIDPVPSDATNSATGLKEHVPWTLNWKLKSFKGRGVILSLVIRGTSDKLEIHIKQANSF